jgi:hypothetical protein
MLNMLEDRGLIDFPTCQKLRAQYLGVDPNLLSKKQLEVATQEPLGDIVREERGMQRAMAQQAMLQSAQQFDLAERSFGIAEKQAKMPPKKARGRVRWVGAICI